LSKNEKLISISIPVYNESSCLADSLGAVHSHMEARFSGRYEIICVDDGSTDNSLEILNGLKDRLPLKVVANPENLGKGAAIRNGMLAAKGDVVFVFDADLSTPLNEIDKFLPHLSEDYDIVIGTRKSASADIKKFQPPHRILLGLGYTYMVNIMMGLKVSDYTCGFKAFSGRAVELIFPKAKIDGWSFDVEILYLAHKNGLRILEKPVTWENRPGSKVRLIRDTIRSFLEILKIKKIHHKDRPR